MDLKEKLKKPACSNWIELAKQKPERFQFVLVNTQYCRYPAQTASWNGAEFKSTEDGAKYRNVTHWAEINDLGQKIPRTDDNDYEKFKLSLSQFHSAFEVVKGVISNDTIDIIYEHLGSSVSYLEDELFKKYNKEDFYCYDEDRQAAEETGNKITRCEVQCEQCKSNKKEGVSSSAH